MVQTPRTRRSPAADSGDGDAPHQDALSSLLDAIDTSSRDESPNTTSNRDIALLDYWITDIDEKISRQLNVLLHQRDFQQLESAWRGLKFLVDHTDFSQSVRIELLDVSKEALRQDFEDAPDVAQSGLFRHTYTEEYDTPGAHPISALISDYAFDNSAQDVTLQRDLSKVAAAAHMPFIGAVSPRFFGRASMEEVASIRDLDDHFDRPAPDGGCTLSRSGVASLYGTLAVWAG